MIESKHSKSGKLPSVGDIKDGLLKMMLYTNVENVTIDENSFSSLPVLRLTSNRISGEIFSNSSEDECRQFYRANNFSNRQSALMRNLFAEAVENNFAASLGKI